MDKRTVGEFFDSLPEKDESPVLSAGSSLREVARAMARGHRRRILYVVDEAGKLSGAVSLDVLKDRLFRCFLDGRVSDAMVVTEHIEELFASERAEDLMDTDPVVCRRSERILDATARMIECDVNDMPILDDRGRVVGNLDILQLFDLWLKEEKELC